MSQGHKQQSPPIEEYQLATIQNTLSCISEVAFLVGAAQKVFYILSNTLSLIIHNVASPLHRSHFSITSHKIH